MKIELTQEEEVLREEITSIVDEMREAFEKSTYAENYEQKLVNAGRKAHELHMMLKARDHEPRHHAYMMKNRGMTSDDPEFYVHFHPLEDLLRFLDDPHANDDPEDVTIGNEFTFRVYTRRWGHDDTYRLTRTETGWKVDHKMIGGPCDKGGRPTLYMNFQQDSVQYPSDLGGRLEWLWRRAAKDGLSHEEVQTALQQLADWVSSVERTAPSTGLWEGY